MIPALDAVLRAARDAHDERMARGFDERVAEEERKAKRAPSAAAREYHIGAAAGLAEAAARCRANVQLRAEMSEWSTRTSGTRPIAIPDELPKGDE